MLYTVSFQSQAFSGVVFHDSHPDVGYSGFATHLLRRTITVTEKVKRGHEAGCLHHALHIWLILQLGGDPHIVIWEQATHLRNSVWWSPPSRNSKGDGREALVPAHPSAGKGLSASWGAFPLNSSLSGFPREMYLYTACHCHPPKKPKTPNQKTPPKPPDSTF